MKNIRLTIFRRFAILLFCVITLMGTLFMIITYLATTFYHEASTELLNKDVAAHIAEFTSPFTPTGISKKKADSVFQNAMVLSPGAEVYFLDTTGKVIYFHASEKDIKQWNVELVSLRKYIASKGEKFIKGTDPKDPAHSKIFSAAEVNDHKKLGYIYVILNSRQSENIMELLFGSHILNLAIKAFIIIILLSLIFSVLYVRRITRNFQHMITVLERFEAGDYTARFHTSARDELQPVTHAFNKMANLLSSTISKLTISEQERKNFIATISHDLRTPLSIARGYTETLMLKKAAADFTTAQREQYSQLIYNKIVQIENMVKQLFELSKIEAVEFSPAKEPFVFSEIVQELIDTSQLVAQEKNIKLSCAECLSHVWINADISMMERVVQNLIDNALKNTPAGGKVEAAVSLEQEGVLFKISNEGSKLSTELFEWINSGDINATRRPQKSGLGLLIVQKILHFHNSRLTVTESPQGKISFSFGLASYQNPL